MSNPDEQLDRLLRAGSRMNRTLPDEPPFGFASRVLAEWRASQNERPDFSELLCKRAILCSVGVAILSILLNFHALESFRGLNAWRAADLRLLDSAMQLQIP